MAERGSSKDRSVNHEERVAALYLGRRSRSSGASDTDKGDVITDTHLFECKQRGQFDKAYPKSYRLVLADFEKICKEAWAVGKEGAMAIRVYNPDSALANKDGNVELIVRRIGDDMGREC